MKNISDLKQLLTIAEATQMLAAHDMGESDDLRSAKDRTRKLINYHIKKGNLSLLQNNTLDRNDFFDWAKDQSNFKGKIDHLISRYNYKPNGGIKYSGSAAVSFLGAIPDDIESAKAVIITLRDEIESLTQESVELKSRNKILEPLAALGEKIKTKNKENAKKPRKV